MTVGSMETKSMSLWWPAIILWSLRSAHHLSSNLVLAKLKMNRALNNNFRKSTLPRVRVHSMANSSFTLARPYSSILSVRVLLVTSAKIDVVDKKTSIYLVRKIRSRTKWNVFALALGSLACEISMKFCPLAPANKPANQPTNESTKLSAVEICLVRFRWHFPLRCAVCRWTHCCFTANR